MTDPSHMDRDIVRDAQIADALQCSTAKAREFIDAANERAKERREHCPACGISVREHVTQELFEQANGIMDCEITIKEHS